jgi:predicted NUDIX family NTP pyrophosphohydrolase
MKIAQIAISEFGQVAEQIFTEEHPKKQARREMSLDTGAVIHKGSGLLGFQSNEAGLLVWSENTAVFKKAAIAGLFGSFEWSRECPNQGRACVLSSVGQMRWLAVGGGVLRVLERGRVRLERAAESRCFDCIGNYVFHGCGSKLVIL